ncbi:ASCH domain-containing protein [Halalkalicoccus subterraneus]|uniref:ASCH domain-containing protein n=1 Tax=Halalkalicoccus subterraneus TaxID=2675002 RepID=UPI000EFC8A78|nr:ASCH domain-containing protein [Halalkalicoccus subterraneus]
MGEIDPDSLLPNDHVKTAVNEGEVTQLSRGASNRYAEEGDTFELDGETFEVVGVEERTLGELTDGDARREGSADLESYRERMNRVHGGNFEWDEDSGIVSYRFERR